MYMYPIFHLLNIKAIYVIQKQMYSISRKIVFITRGTINYNFTVLWATFIEWIAGTIQAAGYSWEQVINASLLPNAIYERGYTYT